MIDVTIIIVNYNVKDYLEQALRSLRRTVKGLSSEIMVVDNSSSDGSVALIESEFKEVVLIENRENLGFAKANNQALKLARGRFILLLNPDTIVQEDTIRVMMDFMENHSEAGAVGCKVLNPDGSLQAACRRSFPTPSVAFFKLIGLSRLFPKSRLFGRYNLTFLDPDEVNEVDALSGSCMFLRREVIDDVGLLDEDFFMFGEDLDWCYRIKRRGWKIYYVPTTQIVHYKGESIRRSEVNSLFAFYNAMYIFVQKHMRRRYLIPFKWFITLGIILKATFSIVGRLFRKSVVPLIDLMLINGAVSLAIVLRFGALVSLPPHYSLKSYGVVHGVSSIVWMLSLAIMGLYGRRKHSISRAFTAAVAGALLVGFIYLFKFEEYGFSRRALAYAAVGVTFLLPGWRILFRLFSRQALGRALRRRRAVVVGTDDHGRALVERLRRHPEVGYDVVGLVNGDRARVGETVDGVEVLGTVEELPQIVRTCQAEEVILSTDSLPYRQTLQLMSSVRDPKVHVKLVPSPFEIMIGQTSIENLGMMSFVDVSDKPPHPWPRVIKRSFDIVVAGMGFVLLSPLLIVQVLMVRIGRGAFNFQSREYCGVKNSRVTLREFSRGTATDGRVSPVYRFMERWYVHRVLWLWPVLKGDISLVGSCLRPSTARSGNNGWNAYHKPGLTGLIQLEEKLNLDPEERLKYELYYRRNQSFLLDGEIVLRFLWHLISGSKGIQG
ncbi:MAG: glycosyltransferase [Gemmatimonadota bacterium]|nr:MAG: glycosyltransferase [Gemmatimonadota bacterium]